MVANVLFVGFAVVIALNAASLAFKLWRVREDGRAAWTEYQEISPEKVEGLDEAAFRRAYYRAYGPRGAVHATIAFLAAAAVTYPALSLLGWVWRLGWIWAGQPPMWDPGTLIWMFYLFFGLILSWTLVAAVVTRRFHRTRTRELPYELARERDGVRDGRE